MRALREPAVPSRITSWSSVPDRINPRPCRLHWSRDWREIGANKIEISDGRYMVQYRDQLMPLIQMDGVSVRTEGSQPVLVFADDGRAAGLVVDEIIDIVEERLNIEVASSQQGILGSAVIKGRATDVIDIGSFPADGLRRLVQAQGDARGRHARSVLLVDDSAFFRNMLAPVLKAAGYQVPARDQRAGRSCRAAVGPGFDAILTDIEMPDMNGFELGDGALR